MAYDSVTHAPVDCREVHLTDPEECNYWMDRFRVRESQVEEAVRMMGPDLGRVSAYLSVFARKPESAPSQ